MAHYLRNHIAVAYGDIFGEMVALSQELGFRVRILQDKAMSDADALLPRHRRRHRQRARRASSTQRGECSARACTRSRSGGPQEDFVEQSSDDIWRACGVAVARGARRGDRLRGEQRSPASASTRPARWSLLDADDRPVTREPDAATTRRT